MKAALAAWIDRLSPGACRRLRAWREVWSGARSDWHAERQIALAQDLFNRQIVAGERRKQELAALLKTPPPPPTVSAFAIADSVARLRDLGDSGRQALGVVSVLPPAETGVARFTLRTFAAAAHDVDIFAPFAGDAAYLAAPTMVQEAAHLRCFAAESVAEGLRSRNYRALVWVLGNSDHHIPVIRLLRGLRHLPWNVPSWIEIHDPVLLNIAAKIVAADGGSLEEVARRHLGPAAAGIDWQTVSTGNHDALIETGFAAVRALLNDVPFAGLIVHSEAARQIVLNDWPDLDPDKIHVLHHPVFERHAPRCDSERSALRIGSFGVPGHGKLTPLIVSAFRTLQRKQPAATLTLAGYGAADFAAREGLLHEPGLIVADAPTDQKFMALMAQCDVAVQLRAKNTGENSGVIAQLIGLDAPVLASPVGAMRDYGEAVAYAPEAADAETLAALMTSEAAQPQRRQAARMAYAIGHSPERFCRNLLALVEGRALECSTPIVLDGPNLPPHWSALQQVLRDIDADRDPYVQNHLLRYRHTLAALGEFLPERLANGGNGAALELGTSWVFAILLKTALGFGRVDVSDRRSDTDAQVLEASFPACGALTAFNVDLESTPLPVEDGAYDLVLCCEVLEHLDVDPMFMLAEINRVLRPGGRLLLSTPNVISGRNVFKILHGYAPHFFMQYQKDRSPYRHNIEYAPDQVAGLMAAAGLRIDRLWTVDAFAAPAPEALRLLAQNGFAVDLRGDNMFVVATKTSPVVERHPGIVYV